MHRTMPNIDLVVKLIGSQDVRKWDDQKLLLWAIEMAIKIETQEILMQNPHA